MNTLQGVCDGRGKKKVVKNVDNKTGEKKKGNAEAAALMVGVVALWVVWLAYLAISQGGVNGY